MDFKENVITSFQKAKQDHNLLKGSVSEWIQYLNTKQMAQELRLKRLEQELKKRIKLIGG